MRTVKYTRGVQGGSGMFAGIGVEPGPRQLTSAQQRRRMIRQKLAEAAGLVKPGELFHAYGPNKTAGADKLMASGSGLGKGIGAAQRDTQQALARRRRAKGARAPGGIAGGRRYMGGA